jgi:hypothetical protein
MRQSHSWFPEYLGVIFCIWWLTTAELYPQHVSYFWLTTLPWLLCSPQVTRQLSCILGSLSTVLPLQLLVIEDWRRDLLALERTRTLCTATDTWGRARMSAAVDNCRGPDAFGDAFFEAVVRRTRLGRCMCTAGFATCISRLTIAASIWKFS